MRASTANFSQRHKGTDRVVRSYDGYSSYLLIIDKASRYVWVFLTASKDPPLDLITAFLQQHGHKDGGSIRTDQGGELARSLKFQDLLLQQVPTAPHRMVPSRYTTTSSPSARAPCCMAQAYPLSIGLPPSSILFTSTIDLFTRKRRKLLSRATTDTNQIYSTSSLLALASASSDQATVEANWIAMTSEVSFWVMPLQIRISSISISTRV